MILLDRSATSTEAFLKGDLDKDGVISMEDALIWYFNYPGNNAYDVTGDGINNQADMDKMFACGSVANSCKAASYSTSLYYIHNDHLGTPKLMTNHVGAIVWNATATPFGKATVNNDYDGDGKAVTLNVRQPRQYYDRETGLYYNLNRYYDPNTGRYVTSDPIGLRGGLNTYAYVENNPLNAIDPEGHTGTIVLPRPMILPRPITTPRPWPFPRDTSSPFPDDGDNSEERAQRCQQEISACSRACTKAMDDPDQCNVYGGSMNKCMKGCISYECGGNNPYGMM